MRDSPGRTLTPWSVIYERWDAAEQPLREALSTLGNGYFATRGAAEEHVASGPHYPATYLAGGYDRQRSRVAKYPLPSVESASRSGCSAASQRS